MAKKRHLSQYDSAGNRRDIYLNDDEVMTGGKTLGEKLDEIDEALGNAGKGSVTGVKVNGTTHAPGDQGVVDIGTVITQHQDISGKVDKVAGKGLSTNDYTDADKTKVDGMKAVATSGSYNDLTDKPTIPAGVVVDPELSDTSENAVQNKVVKAAIDRIQAAIDALTGTGDTTAAINTMNEVATFLAGVTNNETLVGKLNELRTLIASKVDSETGKGLSTEDYTTAEKSKLGALPTKAELDASLAEAGKVKTVSINGQTKTPDTNGDVDLGTIKGEKGDKGDQGDTLVLDPETFDPVTGIINDLTTGGGDKALSAEMGKRLKQNVDAVQANIVNLYNKLANMAFWDAEDKTDAEPTPLDWSVPKVTVTITNNIGSGAVIKRGGTVVSGSLQVDQGDELVLTVEPADADTELSNVTAAIDGGTATALPNNTLTIANVNTNTSIVFAGTAESWETAPKTDVTENGTVVRYGMQQGRSMHASMGYMTAGMTSNNTVPGVIVSPAGYDYSAKIYTNNGGAGGTNPGKSTACFFPTGGKKYLHIKLILNDTETAIASGYDYKIAVGCWDAAVINNASADSTLTTAVAGVVGRINYTIGNVTTYEWEIDLHAFATDNGKQAGDIAYIKFLLSRQQAGTTNGTDSRLWFDNFTLKYRFTDD